MNTPLRPLIVEDSELDAQLLLRKLEQSYRVEEHRRVQTADAMRTALAEQRWEIVLSDYSMPSFSALDALEVLKGTGQDLPFIVISGTVGEDTAVEALKAGAHDFLIKGRLARLVPAIERELREAIVRRERRDAITELQEAVRVRDEFLTIASHELRTPLTALELQLGSVLNFARTRRYLTLPPETLTAKLEMSARQVNRLTALVNRLVDIRQVAPGNTTLSRERLDLGEIVRAALLRAEEAGPPLGAVHLAAEQHIIGYWDPVGLDIVVDNLLSNAIKFGEGKEIDVTLTGNPESARLTVTDHGIGIPAAEQARVFGRFERAVPSRHYGGFGMGLWVARQVVEAHGGTIQVSSTEGAGATFTVDLPIGQESHG